MPILHSSGVMMPGQLGPIRPGLRSAESALDRDHVQHRHAFGNADHQGDLGGDRFEDRIGRKRRRDIDHRGVSPCLLHRLGNGIKDRKIEMARSALARRNAADHLGPVGMACSEWKVPCAPVKPWQMTFVFLSTRNGHYFASFTALTIFSAASARLSAEMIGSPGLSHDFLAQFHVRALKANNQWHVQMHLAGSGNNALGNHITPHDATEDVDEDAPRHWDRTG